MLRSVGSAPFRCVGLKYGSGGRRILRRFLVPVGAAHWAARGSSFCSRSYNLVGAALAAACPGGCFLIWTRWLLGPFAGGVRVTMAPSSAPFGGTFPLVGGRLCGRPHGAALADISGASRNGRVLDPPLRRIWERPRCFRRGRSQTGPPGFASGALAGQSQAQERNRTSPNFCKPRAQWPGRNRGGHSDFARRK